MTKSRRAGAPERRAPVTGFLLKHTPRLRDLVSEYETDCFIDRRMQEFDGNAGTGELYGEVTVLMAIVDVFFEAAFERIATLETELRKAKSLQTKSADTRFALDDLQVEQIDDRNVRLSLVRGDDEASFELKFPVMIDRGIWSDRGVYERGDAVSHGGSIWTAQRDHDLGRPGDSESGWRLAVKAGRDAR